jgi:hypothetical protein
LIASWTISFSLAKSLESKWHNFDYDFKGGNNFLAEQKTTPKIPVDKFFSYKIKSVLVFCGK